MLCPSCSKQIDQNNNFCPYCAKPLQAKCVLDDPVNKAIIWQNAEVPLGQTRCFEFYGERGNLRVSVGTLIVTNQRTLFVFKTGIFSHSYGINFALNLEDIVSAYLGKSGLIDKLIILDKVNQRKEFRDFNAITRNVRLLVPIISSAVSQRKNQIQAMMPKNSSPSQRIASEDNSVKEIIKETRVIVKTRCAYCKNLFEETLDKCPHCGARQN